MSFLAKSLIYLINLFFVITIGAGKLLFISDQKLIQLHVNINNFILKRKWIRVSPKRLLILAPYCLQNSSCHQNIVVDIKNCQSCGACNLKDLTEIYHQYQISLFVVKGGTLALQKAKKERCQGIVAIACEKEVEEGIKNSFPIPVFGVFNERPSGPCCDTKVDVRKVVEGINCFL
ncbi:DUF116 domain-containing protein [bacterium]|nr:DUF116 domain-containing protein [bacterium]MBU1153886.1 DUF116 domain-containing protein [bacterium]MBU1782723.1 DUF116 domain-containing protein [bacterium]MBU2599742.1 DUF116 domain-containing protein [bacterium]